MADQISISPSLFRAFSRSSSPLVRSFITQSALQHVLTCAVAVKLDALNSRESQGCQFSPSFIHYLAKISLFGRVRRWVTLSIRSLPLPSTALTSILNDLIPYFLRQFQLLLVSFDRMTTKEHLHGISASSDRPEPCGDGGASFKRSQPHDRACPADNPFDWEFPDKSESFL